MKAGVSCRPTFYHVCTVFCKEWSDISKVERVEGLQNVETIILGSFISETKKRGQKYLFSERSDNRERWAINVNEGVREKQ